MKNQMTIIAISGLLAFSSSAAFAGVLAGERALEKMIQDNIAQKQAADNTKYNKVAALAGGKADALSAKNNEVISTHNKWCELKAAAESSNSDAAKFKAVEAGAKHAQANQEFIAMQKDILVKMSDSASVAEMINALNATAPSAAGR